MSPFTQPLTYEQIDDMRQRLGRVNPIISAMSVPEFSQRMGKDYGPQYFTAGQDSGAVGNFFKSASTGLDRTLEATGLPNLFGQIMADIGSPFGMEETGREIGEAAPRGFANLAPMFIPGGAVIRGLGMAGSAALSGLDTYAQTGSAAKAAVSGATVPLLPFAGNIAGQGFLRAVGAPLAEAGGREATTIGQRAGEYLSEIAGATAAQQAGSELGSVASGQGLYNPFTPQGLFSMIAGNVPFMGLDLPRQFRPLARGGTSAASPIVGEIGAVDPTNAPELFQADPPPIVETESGGLAVKTPEGNEAAGDLDNAEQIQRTATGKRIYVLDPTTQAPRSAIFQNDPAYQEMQRQMQEANQLVPDANPSADLQNALDSFENEGGPALKAPQEVPLEGPTPELPDTSSIQRSSPYRPSDTEIDAATNVIRQAKREQDLPAALNALYQIGNRLTGLSRDGATRRLQELMGRFGREQGFTPDIIARAKNLYANELQGQIDGLRRSRTPEEIENDRVTRAASMLADLQPEYRDAVAKFIESNSFTPQDKIRQSIKFKERELLTADPTNKVRLESELKGLRSQIQPDNRTLLPEEVESEAASQREGENLTEEFGKDYQQARTDVSEVTPEIYEAAYLAQQKGIPLSRLEPRLKEVVRNANIDRLRTLQERSIVSSHATREEADKALNDLAGQETDPGVKYTVMEDKRDAEPFKVTRLDSKTQQLAETFTERGREGDLRADALERMLRDDEGNRQENLGNWLTERLSSVKAVNMSKTRVAEEMWLNKLRSAYDWALDQVPDRVFGSKVEGGGTPEFQQQNRQRARYIAAASLEPEFYQTQGRKTTIDVDFVQKVLSAAGGLDFKKGPGQPDKEFRRQIRDNAQKWLNAVVDFAQRDPFIQELLKERALRAQYASKPAIGETVEHARASDAVSSFLARHGKPAVKIEVHNDERDIWKKLTPKQQDDLLSGNGTEAVTIDGPNGPTVHLLAQNITMLPWEMSYESAVNRVLWHEMAGHVGLAKVLGSRYMGLLRKVLADMDPEHRDTIRSMWGFEDKHDLRIASEYMALLSQSNPEFGPVKQFFAALKDMARQSGMEMSLTDPDMARLVSQARNYAFRQAGILRPSDDDYGTTFGVSASKSPNPLTPNFSEQLPSIEAKLDSMSDEGSSLRDTPYVQTWQIVEHDLVQHGVPIEDAIRITKNVVRVLSAYPDLGNTEAVRVLRTPGSDDSLGLAVFQGPKRLLGLVPGTSGRENLTRWHAIQTAHEASHIILEGADPNSLLGRSRDETYGMISQMPKDELRDMMMDLASMTFGDKVKQNDQLRGVIEYSLDEPREAMATINALVSNAIYGQDKSVGASLGKIRDMFQYSPPSLSRTLRMLAKEVGQVVRQILNIRDVEASGLTGTRYVSDVSAKAMQKIIDMQESIFKDYDSAEDKAQKMLDLRLLDPTELSNYLLNVPVSEVVNSREKGTSPVESYRMAWRNLDPEETTVSWVKRNLDLPFLLAEDHPSLRPLTKSAWGLGTMARKAVNEALSTFGFSAQGGRIVKDAKFKDFERVSNSTRLRKVLSDLARTGNDSVEAGTGRLDDKQLQDFRASKASDLSTEDWNRVAYTYNSMVEGAGKMTETILRSLYNRAAVTTANLAAVDLEGQQIENIVAAKNELSQAAYEGRVPNLDPAVVNAIGSGTWAKMQLEMQDLVPHVQEVADHLRGRIGYLPELRSGPYKFRYLQPDGTPVTLGASSRADALRRMGDLVKSGEAQANSFEYLNVKESRDEDQVLTKGTLERAQQLELAAIEKLKAAGLEVDDSYIPLQESLRSEYQKSMGDYLKKRTLAAGRENLDMLDVYMNYVQAVSWGASRSFFKNEAGILTKASDITSSQDLTKTAKQYADNVLTPTAKSAQAMRELAFQWNMALNLSTMAFEGLQPLSTLAPWLTKNGAGFFGSYGEIASAMKKVTEVNSGKTTDKALEVMLNRATESGLFEKGPSSDIEDPQTQLATDLSDISAGKKIAAATGNVAKRYMKLTRDLYGTAAFWNNRVAFTAGVLRGRALGYRGEALYDFATRTMGVTMFSGGAANRPIGPGSARGPVAQTAAAAATSLQTYFIGMVSTMARAIKDSRGTAWNSNERKALVQLFGTQMALAGALGMPGVSAAIALLQQMFPDAQIQRTISKLPSDLLGDSPASEWLGDALLYGAPTASSPLDVSSRVGLGNVLGVSSLDGFQVGQLAGPIGSILQNFGQGVQALQNGQFTVAAEDVAPVYIKNLIKAIKDDGVVRDYTGAMVAQMDPGTRALQAIGLRPKELSEYQDRQSQIKRLQDITRRDNSQFTQDMARALLSGDSDSVRRALIEKSQTPGFDARSTARTISEKAVDMSSVKDLGRGGLKSTAAQVSDILSGYRPPSPPMSEVERTLRIAAMQQALGLGLPSIPSPKSLQLAQVVDSLRASHPEMSTDEARVLAQQMLSPASGVAPMRSASPSSLPVLPF